MKQLTEEKSKNKATSSSLILTLIDLIIRIFPRLILSLTLFIGGIALLFLRLPGWSIFLGLPATQIGLIFLVFTFDDLAKKRFSPENYQIIPCSSCKKPTLALNWEKEKTCQECREKIEKEIEIEDKEELKAFS